MFGEADGRETPRAVLVRDALAAAGVPAQLRSDVVRLAWEKLAWNAGFNAVTTLTNRTVGEVLAQSASTDLVLAAMAETDAVATALGIPVRRHRLPAVLDEERTTGLRDVRDLDAAGPAPPAAARARRVERRRRPWRRAHRRGRPGQPGAARPPRPSRPGRGYLIEARDARAISIALIGNSPSSTVAAPASRIVARSAGRADGRTSTRSPSTMYICTSTPR